MDLNEITQIHNKEYEIADKNERIVVAEAPGRIHYLGEHCKKGMGVCLSSGIDKFVRVAVSARKDNSLRFFTAEMCERKRTTIMNMHYKREDRWANHIKLAICLFAEKGCVVKGMNFTVSSDVPQNIGLASAIAMEVAAALALRRLLNSNISDKELITSLDKLHREFYEDENKTADFFVIMNARKDSFLVFDESAGEVSVIKSPVPKYRTLIIDSKVPFIGVDEELRVRRRDLDKGLEILLKKRQVKKIKDFAGADMIELMGNLNEEVRRRSMHAIKELARVDEIAGALETGDLPVITRNIFHSHESLRDLYEVTCPELDWLVKRAQEIDGILGARMTGSGFGGCVYVILPASLTGEYLAKLEEYERIFGFHAVYYEIKPGSGAKVIAK